MTTAVTLGEGKPRIPSPDSSHHAEHHVHSLLLPIIHISIYPKMPPVVSVGRGRQEDGTNSHHSYYQLQNNEPPQKLAVKKKKKLSIISHTFNPVMTNQWQFYPYPTQPWGQLAMSGDIFGCRYSWHLVRRGQKCCSTSYVAQDSLPTIRMIWPQMLTMPRLRKYVLSQCIQSPVLGCRRVKYSFSETQKDKISKAAVPKNQNFCPWTEGPRNCRTSCHTGGSLQQW